jgi:sterol desaturase/sphingolipid hydroxylase (fatty acid hydroxylase superfamily)
MNWLTAIFAGHGASAVICLALVIVERMNGQACTDWWRNLQAWFFQRCFAITILPLFPLWGKGWSLLDGASLPIWIALPIMLLALDLGEYLFHRTQHVVPFLWSMHSLHHSDPDMMSLTGQRHFWGDQLFKQLTIWPAAMLIIAPTPLMGFWIGLAGLWNFVAHTSLKIDFGRWSWLLNSPEYHRRHHSIDPEHYNTNYATLFPIFDVLAGTYHRPDGHPQTGLPRRPDNAFELLIWPLIWNRQSTKIKETDQSVEPA